MLTLTDQDFHRLYTYIQKNYGIDLSKKKQLIASRLSNTLTSQGFGNFSAYGGFIQFLNALRIIKLKDPPVLDLLPGMVLIFPITYFWSC